MEVFTAAQRLRLARSLVRKTGPIYVQFYVTARCHLACEQCNIIYADADAPELTTEEIRRLAANLAEIGVTIVLLIGGEPFVRHDLPDIVRAFTSVGIHVRLQTAGLASRDALERCVDAGAHDISISLDTLDPELQDSINGGFAGSWERALRAVADVSAVFPANGTGFFGTVLMPRNLAHVTEVIEFASAIGWSVSLVPVHVASATRPGGFRTLDPACRFPDESHAAVRALIERVKQMRDAGFHLYDSDEYLDDVVRFVIGEPVRWRRRNGDRCDSPNLYFAIDPAGRIQPCCDYRLDTAYPVHDPDFLGWWRSGRIARDVEPFTRGCDGCMYGSYPEITITARFLGPLLERALFFRGRSPTLAKLDVPALIAQARAIRERSAARDGALHPRG